MNRSRMRVGLREANQRFSKLVKAVKAGEEVVLTERGKPIAVLKPLPKSRGIETGVGQMIAAGLLRPAPRQAPMPAFKPRPIKGRPLSETIREDRSHR